MTALWAIRLLFLSMCIMGGYAISQVRPEYVGGSYAGPLGMMIGFGFGGLLIAWAGAALEKKARILK